MVAEPDGLKLQRQAEDGAKRLHRITGGPAIVALVHGDDAGAAVAHFVIGSRLGEVELAIFAMLQGLERELQPGAAANCDTCSASYARVSAALAALAPGFEPGAPRRGNC